MPKKIYTWKCSTCSKQKQESDPTVECNLCNELVGLECTDLNKEVLDYLHNENVEVTFICKSCKETLPDLRNMLDITRQQQKLKENIDAHDTRITKCEVEIT